MEDVYIDIGGQDQCIRKYFPNKDIVSINELIGVFEDLDNEVGVLNEQLEDLKQDIQDNYKPISHWEEYGISEEDFH